MSKYDFRNTIKYKNRITDEEMSILKTKVQTLDLFEIKNYLDNNNIPYRTEIDVEDKRLNIILLACIYATNKNEDDVIKIIKYFYSKKVSINYYDNLNNLPINHLAIKKNLNILDYLLKNDLANINNVNNDGELILHHLLKFNINNSNNIKDFIKKEDFTNGKKFLEKNKNIIILNRNYSTDSNIFYYIDNSEQYLEIVKNIMGKIRFNPNEIKNSFIFDAIDSMNYLIFFDNNILQQIKKFEDINKIKEYIDESKKIFEENKETYIKYLIKYCNEETNKEIDIDIDDIKVEIEKDTFFDFIYNEDSFNKMFEKIDKKVEDYLNFNCSEYDGDRLGCLSYNDKGCYFNEENNCINLNFTYKRISDNIKKIFKFQEDLINDKDGNFNYKKLIKLYSITLGKTIEEILGEVFVYDDDEINNLINSLFLNDNNIIELFNDEKYNNINKEYYEIINSIKSTLDFCIRNYIKYKINNVILDKIKLVLS